jgi:predicted RNA-binding Zn-ribbon protein involved in translation (DUF1610 family)
MEAKRAFKCTKCGEIHTEEEWANHSGIMFWEVQKRMRTENCFSYICPNCNKVFRYYELIKTVSIKQY